MINEVVEFIRERCEFVGISKAYEEEIASEELTNVCAVRVTGDGTTTNMISGESHYTEQLFQILYKGTTNRPNSRNQIELAFKDLNNTYNLNLDNTRVVSIQGQAPVYAFIERDIYHYSSLITVIYNDR